MDSATSTFAIPTLPCAGNCLPIIYPTLSRGLSCGEILNVCVNAIYVGSVDADPAKWVVTQGMIEREIAKVKKAKAEHWGEKAGAKRRIGF